MENSTLVSNYLPNFEFISSLPPFSSMADNSFAYWLLPLSVSLVLYVYEVLATHKAVKKSAGRVLPGLWLRWMPRVVHNAIFAFKASSLLENGYTRVRDKKGRHDRFSVFSVANKGTSKKFKQKAFQLIRNDGNIVVLPQSLLEQLSALPGNIASPHGALEHDLLGPHTGLNLILESRLHHSIVQRKLRRDCRFWHPELRKS